MQEFKLKQKIEDMIHYLYIALRQFPKSEKFTLASDIKKSAFKVLELTIRCNRTKDKRKLFDAIDVELEILRGLIRLSKELKFLPIKKYEILSEFFAEIGKMLGGWKKFYYRDRAK